MVIHNNPNITRRFNQLFNLKGEDAPIDVTEEIIPTLEIEHNIDIVEGIGTGAPGNLPVYTAPTNKDFYLTGFTFQSYSDAAADNTFQTLTCVINGATKYLLYRLKATTTAENFIFQKEFKHPIKLDRGSQIIGGNAFTAGASGLSIMITGYTDPEN